MRPTLKHYQGKNIAQEYAKIEEEQKRAATLEWERSHPTSVHGAGSSILSSMFGSVSSVSPVRKPTKGPKLTHSPAERDRPSQ